MTSIFSHAINEVLHARERSRNMSDLFLSFGVCKKTIKLKKLPNIYYLLRTKWQARASRMVDSRGSSCVRVVLLVLSLRDWSACPSLAVGSSSIPIMYVENLPGPQTGGYPLVSFLSDRLQKSIFASYFRDSEKFFDHCLRHVF